MNASQAGDAVSAYLQPVYGFALRRCASEQDAQDVTQEILLKVYRALLLRDDIASVPAFLWTTARHVLANYYRGRPKNGIGAGLDELADRVASEEDIAERVAAADAQARLRREIAYLSRLRRRIVVAYYYEEKPQDAIARELGIPLGTVKWHLFEAKKELKQGMETRRTRSELSFSPIQFDLCGTNGSVGALGGCHRFFRSALSQNIAYAVRREDKTANEIADMLGVSPVYVEDEADYLAEYGFLLKEGNRYRINILLDEPTEELVRLHDEMYRRAAADFAGDLYAELTGGTLDRLCQSGRIAGGDGDRNFLLWALIPYIASQGGEELFREEVPFEQAATMRPDGGQNICYTSVPTPGVRPPQYLDSMTRWCGPMWNAAGGYMLWQVDSEWSAPRASDHYQEEAQRVLSLLPRLLGGGALSPEEGAFLGERGILRRGGKDVSGLQAVWIREEETRRELLALGGRIKRAHQEAWDALKAPFIRAVLAATPRHLHTMRKFGLQFLFFADGWFLLHILKALAADGRLAPPAPEQRQALTTLILPNG